MEEKSLSIAFRDSLKDDSISCVADLAEVGLDAVLEDGLFKDIPFVSSVVSLYRIGNSIRERHSIKKLIEFIKAINDNIVDETKRQEYISKFNDNPKYRNQQLEYLLVLIDRYISFDKPHMLAKLYLAYLDGAISWKELTMYAEVIDRFLYGDKEFFVSMTTPYQTFHVPIPDAFLRLSSLGLFDEHSGDVSIPNTIGAIKIPSIQEKTYRLTNFGRTLQEVLMS